jgi:hypothetical protein
MLDLPSAASGPCIRSDSAARLGHCRLRPLSADPGHGPAHADGLGLAINGLGRKAEASPLLREALEIRRNSLGAEPLYLETLAIRRRALGAQHPATRGSVRTLLAFHDSLGKAEKAEPFRVLFDGGSETTASVP